MPIFKIPAITIIVFSTELEIGIRDINYGNHLGHDSLISLLHEARVKFLRKYGYIETDIHGLNMLITSLAVNYKKEVFYGDKLVINIGQHGIDRSGIHLIYSVIDSSNNQEIANAITTVTFYDYKNKRIVVPPEKFISIFEMQ